MSDEHSPLKLGDERVVEIGPVAHGGHFIAHTDGRTLFVRHALPGESVRVRVTEVSRRIVRADAIEVIQPSSDRVVAPCPWSGAGRCGGCDFQHVSLDAQRALKTQVLRESLVRFGGLAKEDPLLATTVEELPGGSDGLRWRTRVTWATAPDGTRGLRPHRSHEVLPVDDCLIAQTEVSRPDVLPPAHVRRHVRDRSWRLGRGDFWQVHPALPEALVRTVLEFGMPTPGSHWVDLYSGAGLFSAFLAEAAGRSGSVDAVEASEDGLRVARRALHDLPQVRLHHADVAVWLPSQGGHPDGVVLDPPRAGAGGQIVRAITGLGPRTVVYVACDPVALARDVSHFAASGYRLEGLRSFDAFPMTHHFESVAVLRSAGGSGSGPNQVSGERPG